jgi:hypothetical protein
VIVGGIVLVKPIFHHLIDKPSVDAFIEVRRFDTQQEKAQEHC